jgi:DNA-binding transcriptional regulator YhcF (GntR family)
MDKLSSEIKFAIMPDWVIELDISHTAFKLYAVLARYADNVTHQAFPSLETLADRLGCTERTIRRAVDELVAKGAITKHNRGRYNSSLYTVMTTPPKLTKMSADVTQMSDEVTNLSKRSDTDVQVTITTELEPKELEPLNIEGFDEFWSIYPLKREKPKAKRAFLKAAKRAKGIDRIIAGAVAYRDDPNRDDMYTKYPTSWLNADCWEDGPLPVRKRKTSAVDNALKLVSYYQNKENQREIEGGSDEPR